MLGQIDSAAFPYFAMIVAYGVLIPNTWTRAARVTGCLALTPFVVFALARLATPEGSAEIRLSTADNVTLAIELLIAMMITLACTRIIHALRTEAFNARQIGQYRLTEKLGSGGMGDVWKAEHRLLARPAAIKTIRPEMVGARDTVQAQSVLRRFEREAQATASLRSVHTIEIYDLGISRDGAFFYVMELLDGHDLEALVKEFGPLSAGRVVHLLLQACESLAEAHEHGLVHRDIKPANIYSCRMGQRCDFVKILDFGLVIGDRGGLDAETRLTMEGTITGTPAYMSPESITGESSVDGRSDIYSLGCVGYWLLTGELVFEASTPMAMALAHARDASAAPSTRTELVIPASLEDTILACLQKRPDDRPDADELARRLLACGVDAWTQEDARAWWSLHSSPASAPGSYRVGDAAEAE